MEKYEIEARKLKESGKLCSNALYEVFKNDLKLEGNPPAPRSIDGICGAILTTEYILKQIGKEEYIEDYKEKFISKFKYIKCLELMRYEHRCSDYVGFSAEYITNLLDK